MKHLAQIQSEFLRCDDFPRRRHRRRMLQRMQQRRDPECIEASHHKEAADKMKVITITCRDQDNSLEDLLNHIQGAGNVGHSFPIIVDEGSEAKTFGWDGDGSDYIKKIKVEKGEE